MVKLRVPLICIIDSFDDMAIVAWCRALKPTLHRTIGNLRFFFQQLSKYLLHGDHLGGISQNRVYMFGTCCGPDTLFSGIPLQDLTNKAALKSLFGFSSHNVHILVQEMFCAQSNEDIDAIAARLRKKCREYTVHYQEGGVSDSVYYPREVLHHLENEYSSNSSMDRIIPPVATAPAQHFDVAKLIRNFIAAKFENMDNFHLVNVLAWNRHPIHPAHLLDDNNLTPALLMSLLVDFGFYKATLVYNASSELEPGYIPYTALLKNVCGVHVAVEQSIAVD